MNITPILFGFLLGAALGVLVTGLRGADFRKESPIAFAGFRLQKCFDRNKCAAVTRSWGTQFLWAAGRMLRLEWIISLTAIWLLVPVLWLAAYWWQFLGIDPDRLRSCFIGTLVGFISGPWVWLHFSRNFPSEDERKKEDPDKTGAEFLDRYRFLTIVLGVVLLFAMAAPLVADLLPRANKFDLFGLSISISERGAGPTSSPLVNPGGSAKGDLAIDRLTHNTGQAWGIGGGDRVSTIKLNLKGFEKLSTQDRDSAFIAYFTHEESRRNNPNWGNKFTDLQDYIELSNALRDETWRDRQFIVRTSSFFGCLNTYASKVQDIHFYFLDVAPYLKELSLLVGPALAGRNAGTLPAQTAAFQEAGQKLLASAGAYIERLSETSAADRGQGSCKPDRQEGGNLSGAPFDLPDGSTPYPVLVLAYSLAAVDSPEAGIYYLSTWIQRAEDQRRTGKPPDSFTLSWHLLRAKLSLAQMASTSIRSLITTERLVVFERQLTDEFASLLGVASTKSWKKLCELAGKSGLHAGLGRRLAFNYAVARNYLFELQTPGLIQSWRASGQTALTNRLYDDLAEAVAFVDSLDCYVGVPAFDQHKSNWIGQFQLNVAQLRIARIHPGMQDSEVRAEQKEIEHLLNQAAIRLVPTPLDASLPVADRLLGSDPFDDQRVRLQVLRTLDKIPP